MIDGELRGVERPVAGASCRRRNRVRLRDERLTRRGRPTMANDLARWQFATTSVYHFFFVPVTIGLAFLVAILETAWYRTDNPDYKRMTRFFGTLLLINVADRRGHGAGAGVRVRDELVDLLALRGRACSGRRWRWRASRAFFLESTFLGLWLFGWDRLPKRVHLATIWVVSLGTMLSAMFILIANSWMQHPVGYKLNHAGQRGAEQRVGAVREPDVRVGLRARNPRVADHRGAS